MFENFCSADAILRGTGKFKVLVLHKFAPREYVEQMTWAVSIKLWTELTCDATNEQYI
jgi:hypothetical protein